MLSKFISVYAYLFFIDIALLCSMTTVLLILYGPWALFGVIACIWLLGSLIQWNFGNRKGFRCVYQAIFAILSPLGGILDEFIKKKKPLFIGLNRIFLYSMIALILGTNHILFLMEDFCQDINRGAFE